MSHDEDTPTMYINDELHYYDYLEEPGEHARYLERIEEVSRLNITWVCMGVLGILSNILVVCVFTRTKMRSPVNFLLAAIAVFDLLTVSSETLLLVLEMNVHLEKGCTNQFNCANNLTIYPRCFSESAASYKVFENCFSTTCHNIAIWLTVALSVSRYIAICSNQLSTNYLSAYRARLALILIVICVIPPLVPYYMSHYVTKFSLYENNTADIVCYDTEFHNGTWWHESYDVFKNVYLYVINKILSTLIMIFFSGNIIVMVYRTGRVRRRLSANGRGRGVDQQKRQSTRITVMLLAVILVDVFTEVPQAVMYLVNVHGGDSEDRFGQTPRLLRYINTSTNLFFYLALSKNFRATFRSTFISSPLMCWKEILSTSDTPLTYL